MPRFRLALALCVVCGLASAAEPRARDLGVPFDGTPGPLNAITDVAGVAVGQVTLIEDLANGHKVRTGVTAILPRGHASYELPAFGAWFALNGNGEMTGTAWLEESGQLEGPVMLTNTHSVGVVRDAVIAERVRAGGADASGYWWSLPVVAETWDGELNDINGFHVHPEDAARALHEAKGGPVAEGNVGGGTGMICHEFKCGIGTASRRVRVGARDYTIGVLVQANYGLRDSLRIAGVPVGQYLRDDRIYSASNPAAGDTGSIIIVVATDAPLLPQQLKRIAKRAGMGLARMGSYAGNGSGDIFVAFSTANADALRDQPLQQASFIGNDHLDGLFEATAQAAEEAIVNAMIAARDMQGDGGHYARAIPHAALVKLLKRFNRYRPPH
ncbi:S58 family peptidase [Rhodanobacter glycinis]|uniref:S58 family peptidase n=1 Tax=Rhodanobacter glycinis TaxID=582702 RepID=A0A502CBT4_9GAMM|nr:P1 family peptidase [Rhodanobacter glycinis]TPG11085.1 S58 family peptidase [Rhodanobacter glycinis]TPG48573.1 S58 family peptidase [Rhodanobacter glycinis]